MCDATRCCGGQSGTGTAKKWNLIQTQTNVMKENESLDGPGFITFIVWQQWHNLFFFFFLNCLLDFLKNIANLCWKLELTISQRFGT